MMQMVDLQRPCRLLKPEIEAAIQDALGRSRFVRKIYQICDVINHAS